jgi:rRNA-processing protein FCF1
MRFMPFLREKDLKNLARSRGVPAAIVAQARKLTMQRSGKK